MLAHRRVKELNHLLEIKAPGDVLHTLAHDIKPFMTAESGHDEQGKGTYQVVFRCPTMDQMQNLHEAFVNFFKKQLVVIKEPEPCLPTKS